MIPRILQLVVAGHRKRHRLLEEAGFDPLQKRDPTGKWTKGAAGRREERKPLVREQKRKQPWRVGVAHLRGVKRPRLRGERHPPGWSDSRGWQQGPQVWVSQVLGDPRPFKQWAEESHVPMPYVIRVSNDTATCEAHKVGYSPAETVSCLDGNVVRMSQAPGHTQQVFDHEVGHLYDREGMDDADRAEVRRILGIPEGTPWFQWDENERASPGEVFADAYSVAAVEPGLDPNFVYIDLRAWGGPVVTGAQIIELREWLRNRPRPRLQIKARISRVRRRRERRVII